MWKENSTMINLRDYLNNSQEESNSLETLKFFLYT